jgi:hypothetical protein
MTALNLTAIACASTLLSGCSFEFPIGNTNQSDFTYPKVAATPLQNVAGQATETSFGYGGTFVTGSLKERAIDQALDGVTGANVLINYVETTKVTLIPLPFIPIFTTTYSVQGMAAEAPAY